MTPSTRRWRADFLTDFGRVLKTWARADHSGLPHRDRLGLPPEYERNFSLRRLARFVVRLRPRAAVREVRKGLDPIGTAFRMVAPDLERWRWLYGALADQESRDLLLTLLAYRALGHRRVRLPLNTPEYWSILNELEQAQSQTDVIDIGFLNWALHRIDLKPWGHEVELYTRASAVMAQFIQQQYYCETPEGAIRPEPNDIVLDAGACYGDTALRFAEDVGPGGQVVSFEFLPSNLELFRKNMSLNPSLAGRVQVVEHPLWSRSGQPLFIHGTGPAARVSDRELGSDQRVKTLAIDNFVFEQGLDRLDFIKMDIEGAEIEALKGAEASIRRFRPKLAICLYHRLSDFHDIPRLLCDLDLGYAFYIRHYTVHLDETVLLATAR